MHEREAGREVILRRLREDLIGPREPDEVFRDLPSDRYLTGILFPQGARMGGEDEDRLEVDGDGDEDRSETGDGAPTRSSFRPSSAGVSFCVASSDDTPRVDVVVSCGVYEHDEDEGTWCRRPAMAKVTGIELTPGRRPMHLADHGLPGLELHFRVAESPKGHLVTMVLLNSWGAHEDKGRHWSEAHSFYQVELAVEPSAGTEFVWRTARAVASDEDAAISRLLYRDARSYATGHTCSAAWDEDGDRVTRVRTTWMPEAEVPLVDPDGDPVFEPLRLDPEMQPFSAGWLAEASPDELVAALIQVPDAYASWLAGQEAVADDLPEDLAATARANLERCRACVDRMRGSIDLVASSEPVRTAFQLANRAVLLQHQWGSSESSSDFVWRPFQLAFQLVALASVVDGQHPDRGTMDLLWFPTGGGKTEAYLGLTAFLLFLRRLQPSGRGDGAGVAVIMRYTLRLLTIQQFERASRLICACEFIRASNETGSELRQRFGADRFAIGLWIGQSTPNKLADVDLTGSSESDPHQLTCCPVCGHEKLHWDKRGRPEAVRVECENAQCPYGSRGVELPVWTVDEDIYREHPSLIIGTIDKFAQLTRNADTGVLLGVGTSHRPPDLIIQDELHLISGPLGTLAGLYEIAIDELCARGGNPPKIIGSTATIRQASQQVAALFDRRTAQFPPPCINAGNSCFAIVDGGSPGRLYVGLTTAGRSAKFALQAAAASQLQSAFDAGIPDDLRDYYVTLVVYFNSLRELGGALTLMQDDVNASIDAYAGRRAETRRLIDPPEELTSRVTHTDIPRILHDLGIGLDSGDPIDVVLATNMISVGMDIDRLALMIMNGQPKAISEYIQSTSRVGRSRGPGLVTVLFNNAKVRDRSHYETFATWHRTLYREVEPTSVTPFAPRALDRAAHAVLVALVRHSIPQMRDAPTLREDVVPEVERLAGLIVERARHVDAREVETVRETLKEFVEQWQSQSGLQYYWNDFRPGSLLRSAEAAAAEETRDDLVFGPWPTPNSLRSVEPGTPFVLVERLR